MKTAPQTVVETSAFIRQSEGCMTIEERTALVNLVAASPKCGVSLGSYLYKLRFGRTGSGKSGGVRVIYLFAHEDIPIFLLAVFAKNERANLSPAEFKTLAAAAVSLVSVYRKE